MIAVWLCALVLAGADGVLAEGDGVLAGGDGRVVALDGDDPGASRTAREALLGTEGAERARSAQALLEDFDSRPTGPRRRRASLLAELAGPDQLPRVVELLHDLDPRVRGSWITLLARPDLPTDDLGPRVTALATLAGKDPNADLRGRALEALGAFDAAPAVEALADLISTLPAPDRALATLALPATPRSADLVRRLVEDGFRAELDLRTPPDVLAAALPLHGRLLAEAKRGGERVAEAAPLVLGLRHADPRVRVAAGAAFDRLLSRLRELGEAERALRVLDGLAEAGFDPRRVHYQRARLALFPGADPAAARSAARAMRDGLEGLRAGARQDALAGGDFGKAGLWLFRSHYLEAMSDLALDHPDRARQALIAARQALDGVLSGRGDLDNEAARLDYVETLNQRALVEVGLALVELAGGREPGSPEVLALTRAAHQLTIEAQGTRARVTGEALTGWDALLDADLSPYHLLFTGESHPGLSIRRAIELQRALGRALAAVAPAEMPGFEPLVGVAPGIADPLVDVERRALLEEAALGRLEGLSELVDRLTERLMRRGGRGWEVPEEQLEQLNRLDRRRQILQMEWSSGERDKSLRELRVPGSQALWLARDLREEGRGAEARQVARKLQSDLDAQGISRWWYYHGQSLLVRADLVIGSAYTDEDEPLKAEQALQGAVDRLEGLERQLSENGAGAGALAPYRALRATALVSLAVNANVKLGDVEGALSYYEQAYELRQDDFMTVLLACYRARSGRDREARDLLRTIRPGPQTWYNIACTYALLGDTKSALDWLEYELQENHASEASRDRQRAWAAGDPDLASLRGDPRFERLVKVR
jgi:tetratricopeptide (TPR) repeat protein